MKRSDKYVQSNAVSRTSKAAARMVRAGRYPLVVVGNQYDGYRLGGERAESIILFGRSFDKQKEAIEFGVEKCGRTAAKVTTPRQKPRKAA